MHEILYKLKEVASNEWIKLGIKALIYLLYLIDHAKVLW